MNKSIVYLLASLTLFSFCSTAAFARGGGSSYSSFYHKEYRNPALWNADAYVPEEDKASMYSNYQMSGGRSIDRYGVVHDRNNTYSPSNSNYVTGTYATGSYVSGNYNPSYAANESTPGQVYGGPAFLGPQNYDSVVQTYKWSCQVKNQATASTPQQNLGTASVHAAKMLAH